jgi:YegS/Rv2252/BmrU family lipid kinase
VKALFVVNRRSGARRRDDVEAAIRNACQWEHDFAACEREALDGIIADAERKDVGVIFAVGGDGTVHEVGKRLIGRSVALGIIPTGSGNGFARHLGLPLNVRGAITACAGGRIETIDTASVNGQPFIGTMGLGFDAWVAEAFGSQEARGFRTYLRVALREIWSYKAQEYEVRAGGETVRRRALLIAVANGGQYGNNAWIAPTASASDGLLDVTIIERASLFSIIRLFARDLRTGGGVTMMRGAHIEVRRSAPGPAHLDGEPIKLPESLTIDVQPRSLRVLLPDVARGI